MKFVGVPVLIFLATGGCARGGGDYPSLRPRDAELRSMAEQVVPPTVVTPDPALDEKLAAARMTLATGRAAFDAALQSSRARVMAGSRAAVGSETWLGAQVALGELDGHRAATLDLVQDLEALAVARAADGPCPAGACGN